MPCRRGLGERFDAAGYCLLVMNIARVRAVVPLSLLALSACEFFHTTTVPAVDNSAPWAIVSVYDDGEHEELRLGNMTITQAVNTRLFDCSGARCTREFGARYERDFA